jgi:rhodanese-related sulfurtransferase
MKTVAKQIAMILLASGLLAVAANLIHPRRISWIQDWSNQVETRAGELDVKLVSLAVAMEMFQAADTAFVDARPRADYITGHIPGAVSIPFERLDDLFPQLAQLIGSGDALVVYCSSRICDDALLLAGEINALGGDAVLFIDGYDGWLKVGGEVER